MKIILVKQSFWMVELNLAQLPTSFTNRTLLVLSHFFCSNVFVSYFSLARWPVHIVQEDVSYCLDLMVLLDRCQHDFFYSVWNPATWFFRVDVIRTPLTISGWPLLKLKVKIRILRRFKEKFSQFLRRYRFERQFFY